MTSEQAEWLKAHPEHRPLMQVGAFGMYQKRGTLKPDGTFVPVTKATPLSEDGGSFGVGIPADRRDVVQQHAPQRPNAGFQTGIRGDKAAPAPLPGANPHAAPAAGPLPKKV